MKLSIAMTSYNAERFINEQLESFASQTRLPDELVVCDDASSDRTGEILRDFQGRVPFPVQVLVNEEQIGYVGNFEQAIRQCTGDVIFLSDHDDHWLPEKLAEHEKIHASNPGVGLVVSNGLTCDENMNPRGMNLLDLSGLNQSRRAAINDGGLLDLVLRTPRLFGCTMSFRSSLREIVLPIPKSYTHDTWLAIALSIFAESRCISDPMIKYRTHKTQTVGIHVDGKGKAPLKARDTYFKNIETERKSCEDLLERCQNFKDRAYRKDAEDLIKGKIAHVKARGKLRRALPSRMTAFGLELLKGGYFRYSTKSVLKSDLRLCLSRPWTPS